MSQLPRLTGNVRPESATGGNTIALQISGTIKGKQIELEDDAGLPFGSPVVVRIEPKPLSLEAKRRLVDTLCGSWADDASLREIFAEIEQRRATTPPRAIDFHVAS